jgi:hypothetical protein
VPGNPDHEVACLLAPETRAQIWRRLAAGEQPAELRRLVTGSPAPAGVAPEAPPEVASP